MVLFCLFAAGAARAETLRVAVASNFLETAAKLAEAFETGSGASVDLVGGATGALFAQISHGAPYDLFLAADADRVRRLEDAGVLAANGRKTYAIGRLVLWAKDPDKLFPDIEASLRHDRVRHFAMADPETAPYGAAAQTVLEALELKDIRALKAVIGTNVAQAFGFVATGNAELGFVALSQVMEADGAWTGVPDGLHAPIVQDVGLLARSQHPAAARAFFDFLSQVEARRIIRAGGYEVPR